MQDYHSILCPTNFSNHCGKALSRALLLAQHSSATITLLHIIDYFPEDIPNDWIAPENQDRETYLTNRSREAMREMVKSLGNPEIDMDVVFTTKSAKHEICHYAEEKETDLIVLSSHAHHGITALLGSTTSAVVHTAPCDVLTVRAT